MRIDLHCHTKAVKKGDSPGRNVTPELFKTKIENADVKIVAITNHNLFDFEQYKVLSAAVSENCIVWPGVEIDVLEPDSKRWHLIIVVNPKEAERFSESVNTLFKDDNLDECTHTLDEIYHIFKMHDAIYIAHFHQKRPAIPTEDGEKLDQLVGEPYRIFKETANENSMSVFANYRYNVLVGSDVQDWNHYEDCTFSELKLPVDSFEQFCLLAKRDTNVVQTLINKKESRDLIAHPAVSINLPVKIYADMNVIFGQKGTGKTEILKSLYESMRSSGFKCVRYVASERDDDFKTLLRAGNLIPDIDKMGISDCSDDFQYIFSWKDSNPTHFANYLNWKKTVGHNANKERMRITHASALPRIINEKERQHATDKTAIDTIIRHFSEIDLFEYLREEDALLLSKLIGKLKNSIYQHRISDLVDEKAISLVNFSINMIKSIADKSTNSVSKPSMAGLLGLAENRLVLLKAINHILNNLSRRETNYREKIGTLDEKGSIYINTRFRMLCQESKTDEFKKGIRKLLSAKEMLEKIAEHIFDSNISEIIQEFCNLCEEQGIYSAAWRTNIR